MLAGIAMNRLKMSVFQFYDLTPLEFECALSDHEKQNENKRRFELEVMRMQTVYFINSSRKKADQFKDGKALMEFYWEKEAAQEPEILSEEQWIELDKRVKQIDEKMQQNK